MPMDDAKRYSAEFEQLMRDAQARAERAEKRDRETIWKGFEKSFNRLADAEKWSAEKRAKAKAFFLAHCLD